MLQQDCRRYGLRTTALLGSGLAVVLMVLFGRLPGDGRWVTDVSNAAHGPAFMLLTVIALSVVANRESPRTSLLAKYSISVIAVIALGLFVEVVQHFTGRHAELRDVWQDTLGVAAGAGAFLIFDHQVTKSTRKRALRWIGLGIAILACVLMLAPLKKTAAAYVHRDRSFPTLFDFSSPLSTYFLDVNQPILAKRDALPAGTSGAKQGAVGLHVRLQDPDQWWRIFLRETYGDWRGYEQLVLDLANPTSTPFLLKLRVRDQEQINVPHAGYSTEIEIAAHSRQTFSVPLDHMTASEGVRHVNASMVESIDLSKNSANRGTEFYVMRIWLE